MVRRVGDSLCPDGLIGLGTGVDDVDAALLASEGISVEVEVEVKFDDVG